MNVSSNFRRSFLICPHSDELRAIEEQIHSRIAQRLLLTPSEKNLLMTTPAGMHQSVVSHDSGIDDFPYIDEDDMTLPIIVARPNRRRRRIQRCKDFIYPFWIGVWDLVYLVPIS